MQAPDTPVRPRATSAPAARRHREMKRLSRVQLDAWPINRGMPSRNQPSVIRSRKRRQTEPSLSAASHSSRSHAEAGPSHQAPDVRHGPAARSTSPRASATIDRNPDRRPRSTVTRIAIGGRKRRRMRCQSASRLRRFGEPAFASRRLAGAGGWERKARSVSSRTHPDAQVSRSTGEPHRRSPTSANAR